MTQPKDDHAEVEKKWRETEEGRLLLYAVIVAAAVIGAYSIYHIAFAKVGFGDSGDWGTFGDYFAGIMNPLLGFFALIILLGTLRVTRRIRDDTAKMMDDQRAALAEQKKDMDEQLALLRQEADQRMQSARLQIHRNVLQGILAAWQNEMSARKYHGTVTVNARVDFTPVQSKYFGDLLYDPRMAQSAEWLHTFDEEMRRMHKEMKEAWQIAFAEPIRLIYEMHAHLLLFRDSGGSHAEAEFYRSRLAPAVRVFSNARFLDDSVSRHFIG